MHATNYILKNFELISDQKGGAFIYTPEISAYIKNQQFIHFLNEIKLSNIHEIDDTTLNNLIAKHTLNDKAIKDYLSQDLKIMSSINHKRFLNLILDIDDNMIRNTLLKNLSYGYGLKVQTKTDETTIDNKSLIVTFSHYYKENKFKNIYEYANKHNAWILTAYAVNNYVLIDNIYNNQNGMPCHFCNFQRHQNIVNSTNGLRQTSWINFCKHLVTEKISVLPAINLTDIERGLVTFWLAKMIKNFVNQLGPRMLINELTKYCWVNLITGEMNQEQAVHWTYCNCLK